MQIGYTVQIAYKLLPPSWQWHKIASWTFRWQTCSLTVTRHFADRTIHWQDDKIATSSTSAFIWRVVSEILSTNWLSAKRPWNDIMSDTRKQWVICQHEGIWEWSSLSTVFRYRHQFAVEDLYSLVQSMQQSAICSARRSSFVKHVAWRLHWRLIFGH